MPGVRLGCVWTLPPGRVPSRWFGRQALWEAALSLGSSALAGSSSASSVCLATAVAAASAGWAGSGWGFWRSEEHTSELQSLMRISYAVFCLKKKNKIQLCKCNDIVYSQTRHNE